MSTWAEDEVQTADLEDRRLNKRFALLLEQLGEHPQLSIPAACGGWKETMGAYRFFDNDKATFKKILAPHRDATVERMKSSPVVLLAQDTTEYDENICLGPKGLGTLKEMAKHARRLHPTIAFTPSRICLGVVKAAYWVRDTESPRHARRHKGVDEKESRHWLESYQDSCALQAQMPDSLLVNLADREGDIYEWFAEYQDYAPTVRAEWIIRATQNRHLLAASEEAAQCLWDALQQAPVLGHTEVNVKPRPNRAARLAHITLRAATVTLKPPARLGYRLPALSINAVLAREETPPAGKEPLEWLLLTSLPVVNFEQAATVVEWYAVRWCIEVYFHVLKSGCQIKRLHLETDERLLPCLALYMVIAWRVLFSLMLARATPDMDCEIVFDPQEWRAAYIVVKRCPPPLTPPRLGEVIRLIASLGGYFARKHDGPPGAKAMWIGLQRLRDFVIALDAQQDVAMRCV
ncbi:transposase [Methylomonas koyamae]|uniref:Transposase n=1 Tax=Methylomonas koyamae TaxID=702114 RepID=A0A177NTT0_9GAMM|nr:IS4 family transposase [Methylomonas koyamae]OAI20639.1 transposase [Methylomonas koyamae]